MTSTMRFLFLLSQMEGFKITATGTYNHGLLIEAEGVAYNGAHRCIEETIENAYIYISARKLAKELNQEGEATNE